jgi:hypothetical protein
VDAVHPPVPVFVPMEHRSELLCAEIFLVVMLIHGPQPERSGNAGESHQYQLLHHEIAALLYEQIKRQIFYVNLVQNIESHIKSTALIKALQRLYLRETALA